jgi:hypothetical protein
LEVCGAIFIVFCGSVPSANPPLATSWLSPTPQAVGRKEVCSRSPPTPKRGWASKHSGGVAFFSLNLLLRKRWGTRKYIGARSPLFFRVEEWASKRSGGEIISPDHYKETRCLQLPVMLNEFGVCDWVSASPGHESPVISAL